MASNKMIVEMRVKVEPSFSDDELQTIEFCLNLAQTCLDRDEFEYATQIEEVEKLIEKVRNI